MVALRAQANKRKLDRQLKHMRGYAGLNTPGENDSEADEMMKQINSNEGSNRGTYSIAPPFQTNSLTPCLGSFSRSSLAYAARRRLWVILSSQTRQVNAKRHEETRATGAARPLGVCLAASQSAWVPCFTRTVVSCCARGYL